MSNRSVNAPVLTRTECRVPRKKEGKKIRRKKMLSFQSMKKQMKLNFGKYGKKNVYEMRREKKKKNNIDK
jgi:hypothetical protein